MFFQVRMWKGLTQPYVSAHQLDKAEKYEGIWKKTFLLLIISLILSTISAYFGIGSEQLSKLIYETTPTEFATIKTLFAIGQVVQTILVTAIIIFFPSLILWIFMDIPYRKLVVMQLFVASIFLMEKVITLPMQLFLGIDHASSPFSLGIIAQFVTEYELISNFFGEISLFSGWAIILQYQFLRIITNRNPKQILLIILSIQLFMWSIAALFSYIKFEVLF